MKKKNKECGNLVNGVWVQSINKETITITSPIDNEMIGTIPAFQHEDIDAVVEAARRAQPSWEAIPLFEKAKYLNKAADILAQRAETIATTLMVEVAKDYKSSLSEVNRTVDFIRYCADVGKDIEGTAVNGENFPGGSKNKLTYVERIAVGVVLAISPFNYPINLSASKIAPALMGGNSVILKPSTQGAICAMELVEAFHDAGIPDGVINTITGQGSVIGDYVVTHEGVDFINFTGSTEVGQHISSIITMKPHILELGGKDAAIVLPDADLEFAVQNIVDGAFSYSGQRCTAVKRILADDETADRLVVMLKEKISALKVGLPQDNASVVPLINEQACVKAKRLIDDALAKGATLLLGNKIEGNLVYPTLLDHVSEDMDIAWIEPFAPILPILRVKNTDDAIRIANESQYGLQSAVFTNDINKAFYIAKRLEVGTVQINNKTERGPDHFPFLGVKASGFGTQGVKYSIEAMTRRKAITINLLHQ